MKIRCPHCRNAVEIVEDESLQDIACPSCGSSFGLLDDETKSMHRAAGRKLGHFTLIEQLGVGAYGAVWKAKDNELDRTVAIKIPRQENLSSEDAAKFVREARSAAQLMHPNIVGVHEVGKEDDTLFIVSNYIEGVTLGDWMTMGSHSFQQSIELLVEIASALHVAHEKGIVHRDLKPSNIMVDADGKPHVMDFGLAKRDAGEITMTLDGQVLGTPAYMSPEQAKGNAHHCDRRADVYALGVILFELLTGERPFRGNSRMLIHQVIYDEAPHTTKFNANVPLDLDTICLKCLEKEPTRRYQTCQELADEFGRYLKGEAIQARPIGSFERMVRFARSNRSQVRAIAAVFIAIGAILFAFVAVGFGVMMLNQRETAITTKNEAVRSQQLAEEREKAARKAELEAQAAEQDALDAMHRADAARRVSEDEKVKAEDARRVAEIEKARAEETARRLDLALKGFAVAVRDSLKDGPIFIVLSDDQRIRERFPTVKSFGEIRKIILEDPEFPPGEFQVYRIFLDDENEPAFEPGGTFAKEAPSLID